MTIIPVYNSSGNEVNQITLNDTISYVNGRVQRGKSVYYKGVGVPYRGHYSFNTDSKYEVFEKSDVFYLGYKVVNPAFKNKTGIFQERYQPFFPDFIGSCSVKEGTILINSISFELSSVEVLDCIKYDDENDQYYYILNYSCGRKHYSTDNGEPLKLKQLVEYLITNDWNLLWDKGSINDITPDGKISDVADLFLSKELKFKLGTIYSILYSLAKTNFSMYQEFLKLYNCYHVDQRSFVFNSAAILSTFVDINEFFPYNDFNKNFKHIVLNYLIQGKNCAYCSCDLYVNQGEQVKQTYIKKAEQELKEIIL